MACDYLAIRRENKEFYGTKIDRTGPMILAGLYGDRTHFIFELLQNAEDALARRRQWKGSRAVSFELTGTHLRVSHFGHPFNDADVRGICGIAESTKGTKLTDIGRFGIGFKSVFAISGRPEVHSGTEAFAIENFVWPIGIPAIQKCDDETVFVLPFNPGDTKAFHDVSQSLQRLSGTAILFLRHIEEVRWDVEGGHSGTYLRDSEDVAPGVRRVTVVGRTNETSEVDDEWLVFSRAVTTRDGHHAGYVETAFAFLEKQGGKQGIVRVSCSPLVVFFPTVVETHLGFLSQGPYRTTPSRENVPPNEPWNQHLVNETGTLLLDACRWLRDNGLLDTTALQCLPIDPSKFGDASMLAPLFQATKTALATESLLPRAGGGHVSAERSRLGRTQALRDLFSPSQLATLFGKQDELHWLSGDISQDRAPELRRYLLQELGMTEITTETIISKLNKVFLEAQTDAWIVALYEFLHEQPYLRSWLDDLPLIRLEDGSHVKTRDDGCLQAFLPSSAVTSFPTVRSSVCATDAARKFLRSLGLTEPDPVDDVIRNVLPKYSGNTVDIDDSQYEADIRRMLTAFGTDSKAHQEKLIDALAKATFVRAVDAGSGSRCFSQPSDVYLATERLKNLFAGVKGILIVDDEYQCLRGDEIRTLLEACGAARCLHPVPTPNTLSVRERHDLRMAAGCEDRTWEEPVQDKTLRGLDQILSAIPSRDNATRIEKTALLWKALADVAERHGERAFSGEYRWTYRRPRIAIFSASFVKKLNNEAWVSDKKGELHSPASILFDSLDWQPHPFLQSQIHFKPPHIESLAREVGIDPDALDLMKQLGLTTKAELAALAARAGLFQTDHTPTEPAQSPSSEKSVPDSPPGLLQRN